MKRFSFVRRGRAGFTLTETIFSTCIFAAVSAGIYSVFVQSQLDVRAGTSQAGFIAQARLAQQQITRIIQNGQAVAVFDQYIDIQTTTTRWRASRLTTAIPIPPPRRTTRCATPPTPLRAAKRRICAPMSCRSGTAPSSKCCRRPPYRSLSGFIWATATWMRIAMPI